MNSLRRLSVIPAVLALVVLAAPAVLAAEPAEVAREIRDDGVFVESGSDLSEATAGDLVATVRNEGERFSIVVLTEDPGSGAVAFGDAVVDRLSDPGLIFVLTPDDLAVVGTGDVYTLDEIDAALDDAVTAGGSDTDYATNFVRSLTGVSVVPQTTAPTQAPVTTAAETTSAASDSSGGGSSGLLWLVVIVGGMGLFLWWMVRKSKKQQTLTTENELAAARAELQSQFDAVANDLLDMEDEVRMADNDRVDELYNTAGQTYQDASDALAEADTPQEFLDIANDLDLAIWQLDSAEAILDGKEAPPKPEPKRLEPEPAPAPAPSPSPQSGGGPLNLPPRPSYPPGGYQRRPTRRSRGMSPSLIEMLITLGAGALSSRSRGSGPSSSRTSAAPSSSSRSSGGGFLPSPSRRGGTSSSSTRRTSSRSTRRGTGGRIRTGRKRRK